MAGVGLRVKNEKWCVFGFRPYDMVGYYGMGINCLPLYFYEHILYLVQIFCSITIVLCSNLVGGSCCCSCYHTKVESTPRFALGWEFENNVQDSQSWDPIFCRYHNKIFCHIVQGFVKLSVNFLLRKNYTEQGCPERCHNH